MANQLVEYKKFTFGDLDEVMIQTIHETIAKDCTEPQFRLFMTIAKSLGANPLLNEIYPTVYQGKLTPQFGIGFHVKQARKHEDYRGYDAQTVHENDIFKMHYEKIEGEERYVAVIDQFDIGFPRGKVVGGFAFAYREGFAPFSVIMDFAEVEDYQNSQVGMQKTMWTKKLVDMFKKHMAKRALNAAFGLGFEDEEMGEPGSTGSYERKEVNPDADHVEEKPVTKPIPKTKATDSKVIDVEATPVDEVAERKELNKTIRERAAVLGHKTDEALGIYIPTIITVPTGQKPTLDQLKEVITAIENQIAAKNDDLLE